jgi:hypothetical protein
MLHRGDSDRGRLHLAVRGHQLLNRSKSAAAKFTGDGVGPGYIRIHHAHQADRFALLRQLVIDAGVVAPKGAHADHRHVDRVVSQLSILPDQEIFFATFAVSFATFAVKAFDRDLCKGVSLRRLFQQSDLAGVIELVLHDATEQVVKVVVVLGFARNLFPQA